MRALASSVFALCLALPCGCSTSVSTPDNQKALDAKLRGLTLRDAVQQLGVKPADCPLFDEPPGVARGVYTKLADGRTVHLWLARHDGVFSEKRDWTFQQIADRRVVGVELEIKR
jgi:hypothetical protein